MFAMESGIGCLSRLGKHNTGVSPGVSWFCILARFNALWLADC
jgi:hypothetical protein